ncbi:hypothetical protein PEPS_35420 (plasmid) [Persicobacter psychrovividus]|uniref:Uncharacterized protein n=1 Tax=Persicobacter psychrovividus TaxID=387638 RepID=A0ABM7VK78_9BACT|nr:hypothetical protein PEPS_35420 [Persicobacter psychrovividus]
MINSKKGSLFGLPFFIIFIMCKVLACYPVVGAVVQLYSLNLTQKIILLAVRMHLRVYPNHPVF